MPKRDESGKDDHPKELDREPAERENQRISVGGKGEHTHAFDLDHSGKHWPHDHESGPKR